MHEYARLDRIDRASIVSGRNGRRPGESAVSRPLEVNAPSAWTIGGLGAAASQERAVGELHQLVLDRTEDTLRKAPRLAPRPPVVTRGSNHAPPRLRARSNFVEQHQRAAHADE